MFNLLFVCTYCASQTGPGGVGNIVGTSSLKIWLRGDDIDANPSTANPVSGTSVATWNDFSGSSFHFSNASSNNRPVYDNSIYPSVYFDASSSVSMANTKYLLNSSASSASSYTQGSVFVAAKHSLVNNSITFFDGDTYSLRIGQWPGTSKLGYTEYNNADYASTLTPTTNNSITSFHKSSSASSMSIFHNNTSTNLTIGSSSQGIPYGRLGTSSTRAIIINKLDDRISGYMFECILFNSPVNTAQQVIVDNYLSAKYGSTPILNNIYIQDNVGNGNYDYDVAGIGRDNSTNLHTDSRGTGIVQINNATNLNDNEYLIWGHNDSARAHLTQTNDVPAAVIRRWKRVWRVNEVSLSGAAINVGNIDMTFDLTGYGPVMQSHLRLLVDINNNGLFADDVPISGATLVSGNLYKFSGVSVIADGLRFTLGTINNGTPLPVDLTNFQLDCIEKGVEIKWETATEINNHHYTLYRSLDAIHWDSITRIEGAGNSYDIKKYQFKDFIYENSTLYYKLRQTDDEGRYEEFPAKGIQCSYNRKSDCYTRFYPNPMTECIFIEGCPSKLEKAEWVNSEGRIVQRLTNPLENEICLDSKTPSGVYILKLYYVNSDMKYIKITKK